MAQPHIEIERKFLVDAPPGDLDRHPADPLRQGYLAVAPDGVEVRMEEEIPIEAERFDALWPLTEGRRVEKTRYLVPLREDLTVELDIYAGDLDGLVTAEIEFPSVEASAAFAPPSWLGTEITGDARYANQSLALHGAPQT
jgi:adenylate cyclase